MAAIVLLTVSSVPTMVSIAQTDSGLGQHAHIVILDATFHKKEEH